MKNSINTKKEEKKIGIFLFVFFLFTAICILLSILCLSETHNPFLSEHFFLFSVLATLLLCGLFIVSVWTVFSNKTILEKILLSMYIFLTFCLLLLFLLQKNGFFLVIRDADSLREYLETSGSWMPVFYVILQYLQVVILPIPSIVSTLAGVALFGAFKATIYSLTGILLGSLTAFYIGRKLGNKAVVWIIREETLKKWQKKLKGKDNLLLSVMFLLPLFPDDVLCFVAGLSTMSLKYFLCIISISRILAIVGTCYSIDFIPFNTWWGLLLWGLFFAGFIVVFILISKNMDKIQARLNKVKKGKDK